MMNDGLQDLTSVAVENPPRKAATDTSRRVTQLRAVDFDRLAGAEPPPSAIEASFTTDGQLGRGGLRLAFLLCGFHVALAERQRKGELLTDHEQSLLSLSRKDFAALRPLVINMAIERLHAVCNAPDLLIPDTETSEVGMLDLFALDTLRRLSRRARQLLEDDGPDAALSLFGNSAEVQEPLAIFQMVFSTSLGLLEAFEAMAASQGGVLARLGEALGSEVERI